jgi:hypothetical protein
MYVRRDDVREIDFTYDQIKDGGMFPLGRYRASMWGSGDEWLKDFVAVKVTEDSPSEIVFKIRPSNVYCGQVVHGITGAPMEGVFVTASHGSRNLALIKAEQWDRFHRLPQNPSIADSLIKELGGDIFLIRAMTRTDDKGRFELRLIPGEGPYPEPGSVGENSELPVKDGVYDHPIDALRYFFVNYKYRGKTISRRY